MNSASRKPRLRFSLLGAIAVAALCSPATASADYAAPPVTITLSPKEATNPVGTFHCVTATVRDAFGQLDSGGYAGISVQNAVTGQVEFSSYGLVLHGTFSMCFSANAPHIDLITAYADSNGNGVQDTGEPSDEATKVWTVETSTAGHATGGGYIQGADGPIAFGFNAESSSSGLRGRCNLVDRASETRIACLNVTLYVQLGAHAYLSGDATVNGIATTYEINVDDFAEPGAGSDTFEIDTGSGYLAAGILSGGNIQVHS